MEWMGSLLLGALGVAAGAWLIVNFEVWGAIMGLVIFAAGLTLEAIGANTGTLFGHYSYTGVLAPLLPMGVPLAIGFAWVMVVVGGLATARMLLGSRRAHDARWNVLLSLLGAALAVGLDFLLEPVAFHVKGYWLWDEAEGGGGYYGVPWSNFVTWLAAVFALNLLVTLRINLWGKLRWPWLPVALYVMNVLMFGIVCVAHGFWWAGLIALALLAIVGWKARSAAGVLRAALRLA
jgi:putative membrane protein